MRHFAFLVREITPDTFRAIRQTDMIDSQIADNAPMGIGNTPIQSIGALCDLIDRKESQQAAPIPEPGPVDVDETPRPEPPEEEYRPTPKAEGITHARKRR